MKKNTAEKVKAKDSRDYVICHGSDKRFLKIFDFLAEELEIPEGVKSFDLNIVFDEALVISNMIYYPRMRLPEDD